MKAFTFVLLFAISAALAFSLEKETDNKIMAREITGTIDVQQNTLSNIDFTTKSNGVLFNGLNGRGATYWPRNSNNQYIFGGGIWFGAKKEYNDETKTYCLISYNPNNGKSWMSPGRIEDGDEIDIAGTKKYRVYFSTDMNLDGTPKNTDYGPNWPIWQTYDPDFRNIGSYVYDEEERNSTFHPMGPDYISDEDIFCTYKDSDLSPYDGPESNRKDKGYPLRTQWEQTIYTWESGIAKDIMIVTYKVINMSQDTLFYCYSGQIIDFDIVNKLYSSGALNDRCTYYFPDEELDLGVAWTDYNHGEDGMGFGYMGMSLLSSPVTDDDLYIINGLPNCSPDQSGLYTFQILSIYQDVNEDISRYNILSSGFYEGDNGPGDYRAILSTYPFHMRPGDTASFAFMITFASPDNGGEANGHPDDMDNLIEKVNFGKDLFCNDVVTKINEREEPTNTSLYGYPNPAGDYVVIEYLLENHTKASLTLFDINGQIVNSYYDIPNAIGQNKYKLDLKNMQGNDLAPGVYYCVLKYGISFKTHKIIIH